MTLTLVLRCWGPGDTSVYTISFWERLHEKDKTVSSVFCIECHLQGPTHKWKVLMTQSNHPKSQILFLAIMMSQLTLMLATSSSGLWLNLVWTVNACFVRISHELWPIVNDFEEFTLHCEWPCGNHRKPYENMFWCLILIYMFLIN